MTECIDLKARYGERWRIGVDESYNAETGAVQNYCRDPWLFYIRGRRGHICPWGGDYLAVCLDSGHVILAGALLRESWVDLDRSQVGDNAEVNAVFHVDYLDQATPYIKPYVVWHHSEENKARAIKSLEKARKVRDQKR
jgi:hypothetical protein